jgi:LAO/AO transport system kinase
MKKNVSDTLQALHNGDILTLSRLISYAENNDSYVDKVLAKVSYQSDKARVIGITGSPGAGKSTLVDKLAVVLSQKGEKVAVLAVDPSSPFTGGAILGDRIRMVRATENKDIFLRSMASRGALGGLAHAVLKAVRLLHAAGFNVVLVETVGVGQAEVDIVRCADTCLVVLVPGMGDSVQAIKAGILEIADIFVVNKSDREGADSLERDLIMLLGLVEYDEKDWRVPIVKTIASEGEGVSKLVEKISLHQAWLLKSEFARVRKTRVIQDAILQFASQALLEKLVEKKNKKIQKLVQLCIDKKTDPISAAKDLLK